MSVSKAVLGLALLVSASVFSFTKPATSAPCVFDCDEELIWAINASGGQVLKYNVNQARTGQVMNQVGGVTKGTSIMTTKTDCLGSEACPFLGYAQAEAASVSSCGGTNGAVVMHCDMP